MTKTIPTAALALLLAGVSAPALAQSAPEDFSGPYIGIFGGYLMENGEDDERLLFDRNFDGNFNDTVVTADGPDAFAPGSCGGTANGPAAAAGCDDDNYGVEAGVRLGWDVRFGDFVVGALGEYSQGQAEDSVTSFSSTPANYTFSRNLEYLAAARLRLGYVAGPALLYATGGYAAGEVSNRFFSSNSTNSFTASVEDDEADGYQAGGGVEYSLAPNLTLTGEYLYTALEPGDFVVRVGPGTSPFFNPFILPPNTAGTDTIRSSDEFNIHSFRIGMNYRF